MPDKPNALEIIASEFTDQWARNLNLVALATPHQGLQARITAAMSATVCQYLVLLCDTFGLDKGRLAAAATQAGQAEREPGRLSPPELRS